MAGALQPGWLGSEAELAREVVEEDHLEHVVTIVRGRETRRMRDPHVRGSLGPLASKNASVNNNL